MKNLVKSFMLIAIMFVAIANGSCSTLLSGNVEEETRTVSNFSGISLSVPANVLLTQGSVYSVIIEADKGILDRIETEVVNGVLRIKTQNGFSMGWGNAKIKIQITMPTVKSLSVSGSGKISAVTPIVADGLSTTVSGSGNINIENLSVKSLSASISGSGGIELSGNSNANDAKTTVSGSGKIALNGIRFADANVSISGSGRIKIFAKDNLKARVSGSGSIAYEGNPLIDAKVSGSGKIRNI
jgi:hypothetical protein